MFLKRNLFECTLWVWARGSVRVWWHRTALPFHLLWSELPAHTSERRTKIMRKFRIKKSVFCKNKRLCCRSAVLMFGARWCSSWNILATTTSVVRALYVFRQSHQCVREVNISTAVFMLDPISTPLVFVKHHNFIYIPPILVFPLDVELKNGRNKFKSDFNYTRTRFDDDSRSGKCSPRARLVAIFFLIYVVTRCFVFIPACCGCELIFRDNFAFISAAIGGIKSARFEKFQLYALVQRN